MAHQLHERDSALKWFEKVSYAKFAPVPLGLVRAVNDFALVIPCHGHTPPSPHGCFIIRWKPRYASAYKHHRIQCWYFHVSIITTELVYCFGEFAEGHTLSGLEYVFNPGGVMFVVEKTYSL